MSASRLHGEDAHTPKDCHRGLLKQLLELLCPVHELRFQVNASLAELHLQMYARDELCAPERLR